MSSPTAQAEVSVVSTPAPESIPYNLQFPRANMEPGSFRSDTGSPWIPSWSSRLMGRVRFEEWKEFHEYAESAVAECVQVLRRLKNDDIRPHADDNGDKGRGRNGETGEITGKRFKVLKRINLCLELVDIYLLGEQFKNKRSMSGVHNRAVRGATAIASAFHPQSGVCEKELEPLICGRAGGIPVRKPLLITPDCIVVDSEWSEGNRPRVTVEYRTPDIELYSRGARPSSACELARSYQKLFDGQISDEYAAENIHLRRALTQVIVQGLHTTTGFTVLYTHNEAVFVSLRRPLCKDQHVLVEAHVSRVYACDERVSTMHGLVAIIRQSLVEKGERLDDVEKCVVALANLPTAVDNREVGRSQMPNSSNKSGSPREQGGPTADLLANEGSNLTKETSGPQEEGVVPPAEISRKSTVVVSVEIDCSQMPNSSHKSGSPREQSGPTTGLLANEGSNLTKETSGPQEEGVPPPAEISRKSKRSREGEEEAGPASSRVKRTTGDVVKKDVAEDADDTVEKLLRCHEGVIGSGSSGTVLVGSTNGVRVAVKYWSFEKSAGLEWLVNEMDVYEMLASEHPEVMGTAVARLVCMRRDPKNVSESVLVTELVGRGAGRDADLHSNELGPMYVDGEMVSEEDELKISEAAERNLKMLYACGVSHGDTSLRNLRVERVVGEDGVAGWKVWWIDLGFASRCQAGQFSGDLALVSSWKKAALARLKGRKERDRSATLDQSFSEEVTETLIKRSL